MFGIKRVLLAAVVGGGGVYFADHYHVVHTVDGFVVVPRAQQIPLRTAYADVRGWDATKWAQYPELSESLLKDGRGGLLIDGTVDGVLEQLGERIGLTGGDDAAGTNTPSTARPPIVFGTPTAHGSTSAPAATAPADDSLLGRLSRQLQGGTTTDSTLESRPMIRAVPNMETAPLQPAFQPAQPPLTNERADISPQQLPQDFLPSIHSAAMQRITSEIGTRTTPAAGGWTPSMEPVQTIMSGALGMPASPPAASQLMPPSPATITPQFNASGDAPNTPLNFDANRLRESLPTTIQQELLKGLHTEPSAGLDGSVFRSF